MTKKIILNFIPEENLYVAKNIPLERDFFIALKENGFLINLSSFEDLHDILISDVHIVDENSGKDNVLVVIYTDQPVPEKWKDDVGRFLNKDFINKIDESENLECMFDLSKEYITVVEPGVSIMIDIPM